MTTRSALTAAARLNAGDVTCQASVAAMLGSRQAARPSTVGRGG